MKRTVPSRPTPGFSPFADIGVSGFGGGRLLAALKSDPLSLSLPLPLPLLLFGPDCLPCLLPAPFSDDLLLLLLILLVCLVESRQLVNRGSLSSSACLLRGMRIAKNASRGYSGPTTVLER